MLARARGDTLRTGQGEHRLEPGVEKSPGLHGKHAGCAVRPWKNPPGHCCVWGGCELGWFDGKQGN